jgi:hypothetical protein
MKNQINSQCLAVSWNINPKHPHRIVVPYASAANSTVYSSSTLPHISLHLTHHVILGSAVCGNCC